VLVTIAISVVNSLGEHYIIISQFRYFCCFSI
jgi:hypothetical protein